MPEPRPITMVRSTPCHGNDHGGHLCVASNDPRLTTIFRQDPELSRAFDEGDMIQHHVKVVEVTSHWQKLLSILEESELHFYQHLAKLVRDEVAKLWPNHKLKPKKKGEPVSGRMTFPGNTKT